MAGEVIRQKQIEFLAHAKFNGQGQDGKRTEKGPEFDKILLRGDKRLGPACPCCGNKSGDILRCIVVMIPELLGAGHGKPLQPQGLVKGIRVCDSGKGKHLHALGLGQGAGLILAAVPDPGRKI
ncbi:MAG: hypothetical protein ACD_74C00055G0001, partial [uncultured bacterium]